MFPKCQQNRVYPPQRYFELKIFQFPPDKSYLHCLSFPLMLMSIISVWKALKNLSLTLKDITYLHHFLVNGNCQSGKVCVYIDTDCHCIMLLGLDNGGQD